MKWSDSDDWMYSPVIACVFWTVTLFYFAFYHFEYLLISKRSSVIPSFSLTLKKIKDRITIVSILKYTQVVKGLRVYIKAHLKIKK